MTGSRPGPLEGDWEEKGDDKSGPVEWVDQDTDWASQILGIYPEERGPFAWLEELGQMERLCAD